MFFHEVSVVMSRNWSFFYRNLKNERSKRQMSIDQFAEFLEIPSPTYETYEYEKSKPRAEQLGKISKALNVSIDALFTDPDAPENFHSKVETLLRKIAEANPDADIPTIKKMEIEISFLKKQMQEIIEHQATLKTELKIKDEEIRKLRQKNRELLSSALDDKTSDIRIENNENDKAAENVLSIKDLKIDRLLNENPEVREIIEMLERKIPPGKIARKIEEQIKKHYDQKKDDIS